jgi:hypothetical protein
MQSASPVRKTLVSSVFGDCCIIRLMCSSEKTSFHMPYDPTGRRLSITMQLQIGGLFTRNLTLSRFGFIFSRGSVAGASTVHVR